MYLWHGGVPYEEASISSISSREQMEIISIETSELCLLLKIRECKFVDGTVRRDLYAWAVVAFRISNLFAMTGVSVLRNDRRKLIICGWRLDV